MTKKISLTPKSFLSLMGSIYGLRTTENSILQKYAQKEGDFYAYSKSGSIVDYNPHTYASRTVNISGKDVTVGPMVVSSIGTDSNKKQIENGELSRNIDNLPDFGYNVMSITKKLNFAYYKFSRFFGDELLFKINFTKTSESQKFDDNYKKFITDVSTFTSKSLSDIKSEATKLGIYSVDDASNLYSKGTIDYSTYSVIRTCFGNYDFATKYNDFIKDNYIFNVEIEYENEDESIIEGLITEDRPTGSIGFFGNTLIDLSTGIIYMSTNDIGARIPLMTLKTYFKYVEGCNDDRYIQERIKQFIIYRMNGITGTDNKTKQAIDSPDKKFFVDDINSLYSSLGIIPEDMRFIIKQKQVTTQETLQVPDYQGSFLSYFIKRINRTIDYTKEYDELAKKNSSYLSREDLLWQQKDLQNVHDIKSLLIGDDFSSARNFSSYEEWVNTTLRSEDVRTAGCIKSVSYFMKELADIRTLISSLLSLLYSPCDRAGTISNSVSGTIISGTIINVEILNDVSLDVLGIISHRNKITSSGVASQDDINDILKYASEVNGIINSVDYMNSLKVDIADVCTALDCHFGRPGSWETKNVLGSVTSAKNASQSEGVHLHNNSNPSKVAKLTMVASKSFTGDRNSYYIYDSFLPNNIATYAAYGDTLTTSGTTSTTGDDWRALNLIFNSCNRFQHGLEELTPSGNRREETEDLSIRKSLLASQMDVVMATEDSYWGLDFMNYDKGIINPKWSEFNYMSPAAQANAEVRAAFGNTMDTTTAGIIGRVQDSSSYYTSYYAGRSSEYTNNLFSTDAGYQVTDSDNYTNYNISRYINTSDRMKDFLGIEKQMSNYSKEIWKLFANLDNI